MKTVYDNFDQDRSARIFFFQSKTGPTSWGIMILGQLDDLNTNSLNK